VNSVTWLLYRAAIMETEARDAFLASVAVVTRCVIVTNYKVAKDPIAVRLGQVNDLLVW